MLAGSGIKVKKMSRGVLKGKMSRKRISNKDNDEVGKGVGYVFWPQRKK